MYKITGTAIIIAINVLAAGLVYRYVAPYIFVNRPVGIPINKSQTTTLFGNNLHHFYTLGSNQTLKYKAPWYTDSVMQYTNADGLADRKNYDLVKSDRVFRIIALGDSFTQGVFVKLDESFPEVLEERLKEVSYQGIDRVEVLNFGVGGYDIEYAAEKLRLQGIKYKPDLVVWLLKFDDFYLINDDMVGARASLEEELSVKGLGINSGKFEEVVTWMYAFGELYARNFSVKSSLSYQTAKLAQVGEYYSGPIMILIFENEDPMVVRALADMQRIDSRFLLVTLPSTVSRFPDMHPNKEGHQVIARVLYDAVDAFLKTEASGQDRR